MGKKSILFFLIAAGLLLVVCNLSTNKTTSGGKATNVSQLFPTETDISNWKKNTTYGYTTWTAANFNQDIDGGYEVYTDRGMIECGDIAMDGPNGAELLHQSFIMDFGFDSTATVMYNYKKDQFSTQAVAISGYDQADAFAYPGIGVITAFAHFNKFYFELQFSGYSDQAQALQAASLFLGLFKSKIE